MSSNLLPIQDACTKQPCGAVFRIFIPAGTTINLLNLIELTSPSGICLILRLPFLAGECKPTHNYDRIFDTIRRSGGTVEAVNY